ncbi:SLC22A7 [Acrasis kona]|uniref:SLC22A7 n=1 Tax=Acrasis kona TaxID=1008807 RepID=A0AAW2YI54_9EUKA
MMNKRYSNIINTNLNKPVYEAPGSIGAFPIATQFVQPVDTNKRQNFEAFSSTSSILAAISFWTGAALIIAACGLILRDSRYHYTAIGVLLIIGFSLWLLGSILNWLPTIGGFFRANRSGYHIFNFIACLLGMVSFSLFIAGSGCWLSRFGNVHTSGEIVWIIAGGFYIASILVRDLGLRYDAMDTYKKHGSTTLIPPTETLQNNDPNKNDLKLHMSSVWGNAIATDSYLITAVLFLLGSIMFRVRGSNGSSTLAGRQFEIAAGCMWIVGASIVIFAALAHCVARR